MRAIHGVAFWLVVFASVARGDQQLSLQEQRAKNYTADGIDFAITKSEFLKRFPYAIRLNDADDRHGQQSFGIGTQKATYLVAFFLDEELEILSLAFDNASAARYGGPDKIIERLSQSFGDPIVRPGVPTGWSFPKADRQICLVQTPEMFQIIASSVRVGAILAKRKKEASSHPAASAPAVAETRPAPPKPKRSSDSNLFYDPSRELPYKANDTSYHQTREEAIAALAKQFERTPAWIEQHMGASNDLQAIHQSLWEPILAQELIKVSSAPSRAGRVDYSMVSTLRSAWQKDKMRDEPRSTQAQALLLMHAIVENDIPDAADREATLDYIQSNIDSW